MKPGWEKTTLGELCKIARGGSPRPIEKFMTDDPNGINWIKIGDATRSGKYIYETREKITQDGVSRSRMVHEGDFLLSNSMSFGRPYVMKTSGCIHDGWLVLTPDTKRADQDFLYHLLGSPQVFQQFDALAAGSTVRNLNIGLVERVKIPLPPLHEQKRIIEVLDAAFEGLSRARAHTETNLQNARELFEQLREKTLFSGEHEWDLTPLGSLIDIKHGYAFKSEFFTEVGDFVLLTPGNYFETGGYRDRGEKQKYFCGEIPRDFLLSKGDLLVAMTEQAPGLLGSCIVVPDDERFLHNQRLGLISPKAGVEFCNDYFAHVFNIAGFRKSLSDTCSGATVRHTSPSRIQAVSIPFVGSAIEQRRIADLLTEYENETSLLQSHYRAKLADLEALRQALLQKAFAGELT